MKRVVAIAVMALGLTAGGANASAFQGRDANNQADLTCAVSGATKCTSFYYSTLGITILNNWSIGKGYGYRADQGPESAQSIAASAGQLATGLSGWMLPTGGGYSKYLLGPCCQYLSIWNAVGGTIAGLQAQFDGVTVLNGSNYPNGYYWSSTERLDPDYFDWFNGSLRYNGPPGYLNPWQYVFSTGNGTSGSTSKGEVFLL